MATASSLKSGTGESESSECTHLLIVYGTSTGTAREVAQRIAREAYSFTSGDPPVRYFVPQVMSMKDVTVEYLTENWQGDCRKVVFIVSTTGQGEFPEDSKSFWKTLCKKSGLPQILIEYAVIGLGDSSYELYNYPGKKLHRRLQQLSGKPCFDVCLCDDQHDLGYVGALNSFLEKCWDQWLPPKLEKKVSRNLQPVARYSMTSSSSPDDEQSDISSPKIEMRRLIRNDRITSLDHFQDTRLIAFDTVNSNHLQFDEGDVVQVYPENFPDNIQLFFELFPHLRDQPPFYLKSDPDMKWVSIPPELCVLCGPQPWTWEKVATHLLDLQTIPGVFTFEILRSFATDPLLVEKFDEYCRPEGLEELYNYVNRPRRTVLEILQDFPSTAALLPPNYLFDLIPFIRPRAFSIASPPKENHHIEILVAVLEYKTNLKQPRRGTCSYWLAHHCSIGHSVGIYCEKGSLRPPNEDSHVLMIGPGTGVAPFRSMIKQHVEEWDKHLFFGCRNKDKDYYFSSELEVLTMQGALKLYNAFSRTDDGRKLDYVQDVILRQAPLIKHVVESSLPLYIYVCGRSGDMPKDVCNAFKTVFKEAGVEDPELLLKRMLNTGQYQAETY